MKNQKQYDGLNEILDSKHQLRRSKIESLVNKERSKLITILKDKKESLRNRRKALMALSIVDGAKSKKEIFNIIGDKNAPDRLRISALSALTHLKQEGEEKALEKLKSGSLIEDVQILRTLAQIGSIDCLDQLENVRFKSDLLQKELALTKAIISYRNNKSCNFPFQLGNKRSTRPTSEAIKMKFDKVDVKKLSEVLTERIDTTYNLSIDDSTACRINCAGKDILVVLLNPEGKSSLVEQITEQEALAGLIYHYFKEDNSWSLANFIFTKPSEKGVDFNLVRRDGEVIYSGVGNRNKNNIFEFSASDVQRPGSIASYISGFVENRTLTLNNGWSEIRAKNKLVATEFKRN